MQASASASATATAAPRAAGGPAAGRGAPMQAAAAPRAPSPASATQAFTADGDANATTSAPRAAASASAGSAATGSVLYVLRRTTSAPRAARPACRTQCPRPQTSHAPHMQHAQDRAAWHPVEQRAGLPGGGFACRSRSTRPDRQAHQEAGGEGAQGGPAGRSRPWRRRSIARAAPGRPPKAAAPRPGAPHWPARGRTHVSAGPRGSHHGVLGVQLCTA